MTQKEPNICETGASCDCGRALNGLKLIFICMGGIPPDKMMSTNKLQGIMLENVSLGHENVKKYLGNTDTGVLELQVNTKTT